MHKMVVAKRAYGLFIRMGLCYFPKLRIVGGGKMRGFILGCVLLCMVMPVAAERVGVPVELTTAYGTFFDAYEVGSEDSDQSVLIIHDRWGLDNLALDWADRFAKEGYLALAIDLYDGRVADKGDAAHAKALIRQMAPEWVDANLKAAVKYLNSRPSRKVSVVGLGYGGAAAMRATVLEPFAIISTVNIFGRVPADTEDLRGINGPVLALFSDQDGWVGEKEIEAFEVMMFKLRNALQVARIDAGQGFLDPEHSSYNKAEAERVWNRAFTFVAETQ